jgi:hypothetical protein
MRSRVWKALSEKWNAVRIHTPGRHCKRKRSNPWPASANAKAGLLRRFAPRNDEKQPCHWRSPQKADVPPILWLTSRHRESTNANGLAVASLKF